MSPTLKELFVEWVEPDVAHYYVACVLGLLPFDDSQEGWMKFKGIFNTRNEMSDFIYGIIEQFVECGLLLKNEDLQYHWNNELLLRQR